MVEAPPSLEDPFRGTRGNSARPRKTWGKLEGRGFCSTNRLRGNRNTAMQQDLHIHFFKPLS
jgi:hypothetical protein